jgi:hypothetical protein
MDVMVIVHESMVKTSTSVPVIWHTCLSVDERANDLA